MRGGGWMSSGRVVIVNYPQVEISRPVRGRPGRRYLNSIPDTLMTKITCKKGDIYFLILERSSEYS